LSCSEIPTTLFSCTTRQLVDQNVNWSEESVNLAMVQELKTLLKPIQNKDFDFGGYNE
jgi:L-galactose dehydrogenase